MDSDPLNDMGDLFLYAERVVGRAVLESDSRGSLTYDRPELHSEAQVGADIYQMSL